MKFKVHLFREYRETYEVEADNADAAIECVDKTSELSTRCKARCKTISLTAWLTQSFLTAPLTTPTRFGASS